MENAEKKAKIAELLYRYALTRKWLLLRLQTLGESVTGAELTGYLNGYRSGPKGERVIDLCLQELQKYGELYAR